MTANLKECGVDPLMAGRIRDILTGFVLRPVTAVDGDVQEGKIVWHFRIWKSLNHNECSKEMWPSALQIECAVTLNLTLRK